MLIALFRMFGDPGFLVAQFLHVVGVARPRPVALLLRQPRRKFIVALGLAVSIPLAKSAHTYPVDCAILLCRAGGFPRLG